MARSQLQNLFKASLESQEDEVVEIVGGSDSMEAAMLSIEEARQEMDAAAGDVEELEEIAEGLEGILVSVEATQEHGGLDAQAAQMMHLAVGAYTNRLGMESSDVAPSLEAFGGDTGRQSATTVSVESIGKAVRSVWNAIKTAIERAIKATADFFAKIFGGVGKVIERIAALKKQVGELKGSASGEMDVPGTTFLHVGGKASSSDIERGLKALDEVGEVLYNKYMPAVADYYEALAQKFKAGDVQKADDESKVDGAAQEVDKKAEEAAAEAKKVVSKEFSGGKVVEEDGEGGIPKIAEKTKAPGANAKTKVLTKQEMTSILGTCEAIAKRIDGAKAKQKEFEDARKMAVKDAEEFVKASERNALGKAWSQAKANVMLRKAQRDLSRPVAQITSHSFGTLRAALSLVEAATKQYKEEAAS